MYGSSRAYAVTVKPGLDLPIGYFSGKKYPRMFQENFRAMGCPSDTVQQKLWNMSCTIVDQSPEGAVKHIPENIPGACFAARQPEVAFIRES